ncbi:unnamed protein product [Cuscuta epithymum]|uniref:X8 domain-containing protein n=2 Tax=Cuscuta epithymum TaxID=186058 RepID=A0AAV0FBX8_9ASTE|nr:unnamed protein product [Cuscuta epithymum]
MAWIWKCLMLFLVLFGDHVIVDCFIGINWGRSASQNLVPSMVVDLLLQNDIPNLRIYGPKPSILVAFEGSPTAIAVTIMKDFVMRKKWTNVKSMDDMLENLIIPPIQRGVNIQTLIIVHEPFTMVRPILWNITDVFRQTRASLDNNNLKYIRTTTSHFTDVITMTKKPSEADFRPDIKGTMMGLLEIINKTNSFFTYNIFPITSVEQYKWPMEFGFMDNKSNFTVVDGAYTYTNAFEFLFDALVVALEKAGYPDMEIQIGQIGWPTDGSKDATVENAERFYRSFIPHIVKNRGTPRRRNISIDVYLNSLGDENRNIIEYGAYQRHFGIYAYDGSPKFPIDISGNGRTVYPTEAKGTVKSPSRWCIFKGDMSNKALVEAQVAAACNMSDCTELLPGASCGRIGYADRVSYAFNALYQIQNQENQAGACEFAGLGALTPIDPSIGECKYPVGILTAETVDGGIQLAENVFNYALNTGISSSASPACNISLEQVFFVLPMYIIFLVLITK